MTNYPGLGHRVSFPLLLLAIAGCGSDDKDAASDDGERGPAYVFMTQTYTVDDRTVFLKITDTLDLDDGDLDIGDSYEFPSVANFSTIGGRLYVSSGEAKTIKDFDVTASLKLVEGVTLDFSEYPLEDNANFHYQYVVGDDKVVLPFETTSRLVWDPKAMEIAATIEDSDVPFLKDGLKVGSDGNRSATRFENGKMLQPFYTTDENDLYGPISYIASYDSDIRETAVMQADCPALERVTRAEDGTSYFSTQWNSPVTHLFGIAKANCAVRVSPDGELDESWTTDFTEQTGGRFVQNFRYLRGGKAIGNVFNHESFPSDFTGEYDSALEDEIWEGGYYDAWLFDVENGTARKIEGIDVPLTPVLQSEVVDDRVFVLTPINDGELTKIWEISDDAAATLRYEMTGDVYKIERLR